MPNDVSAFYQTVVAAANDASKLLAPSWNALDSVYTNYRPETAQIFESLTIGIPKDPSASVADIGAGDVIITDADFNDVDLKLDQHPSFAFVIRDWEKYRASADVRERFMDAALIGVKNYINAAVASQFTTTNFPTHTAISATSGLVTTDKFLEGFAKLSDAKVPVANNPENMTLLLPSVPYTKVLGNSGWNDAQIAGDERASKVHESGVIPTSYGTKIKLDQQMPTSGAPGSRTFTGAYFHRSAIALVTRPLPKPDPKRVDFTYVDFYGVPIRIQITSEPLKSGVVVIIDAGFGVKVVRPEMGVIVTIAE